MSALTQVVTAADESKTKHPTGTSGPVEQATGPRRFLQPEKSRMTFE
jgi:hypothetical protein